MIDRYMNSHRLNTALAKLAILLYAAFAHAGVTQAQSDALSFNFNSSGESQLTVQVSASISTKNAQPGNQVVIAIVMDHAKHYHTWPAAMLDVLPESVAEFAINTAVSIDSLPDNIKRDGSIQWPNPSPSTVADPSGEQDTLELMTFSGKAIIYVPFRVDKTATAGPRQITLTLSYQACNETQCDIPQDDELTIEFQVLPAGETATTENDSERPALFAGFDPSRAGPNAANEGSESDGDPKKSGSTFFGLSMPQPDSPAGIALIMLFSALGGLILNLTPCVLPMIPIKVLTISKHAGEKRSRAFMLSMWMAVGVIAFWVGIGLPVAFVADFVDPSFIFGVWWVTGIIGLIIAAMSVGIMGLFQINLPKQVYMVNPKADSASGSFMFGVMTAILGLPCFGFIAGALLAGAATMEPLLVVTIFACIGIGMASPYVVLALFPGLVDKLPRTGPASELVKQVMGLLMLAAAAYFLGTSVLSLGSGAGWIFPWWGKATHWWVIGLISLATGVWLIVQTFRITKRIQPRVVFMLVGLFLAASGGGIAYNQTSHQYHNFWQPFTPEALQSALDDGKIVVLDFTAEWCLNCKTLEATVLSRNPVKPELLSSDVVPMVADVTSTKAPGWKTLRDLGQTGIPLLVVYAPGQEDPVWMSSAYSSNQVVKAIEQARSQARLSTGQ